MKAMVTGGTGFVGGHLIEQLRRNNHEVTALVRSPHKAASLHEAGVRIVDGDLDDHRALQAASEGRDVVFHVAGLVAARNEREFVRVNRDGTRNVVNSLDRSTRFVLVSSLAAAGPSEPGRPLAGHEKPAPVTAYGRSKLAAEELVRRSKLDWTIVRPPMVYGPRDTEVLKVFQVARTGVVPVFGSRHQELSAVYATDLAAALLDLVGVERTVGRTYYACHPEVFTSEQFARAAGRAIGRKVRVVVLPARMTRGLLGLTGAVARATGRTTILNRDKADELLQAAWTGDPSLLTRDTGWRAAHDVETGVQATVTWCRANGWL